METIIGKTFTRETVVMDERTYVNCSFTDCEIVYSGGDCNWITSKFDNCKVTMVGSAAKTMNFAANIGIVPKPSNNEQAKPEVKLSDDDGGVFH